MQSFTLIADTTSLTASRQQIVENDITAVSCSAGTAFPTVNVYAGMMCWRTDESKLYELKDTTPTWVLLLDLSGASAVVAKATALATARTIDGQNFDGTSNITVIAPGINAATGKTTPIDADAMGLVDSAASNVLKKVTWANVKATLKAYFDTLYTTAALVISTARTFTSTQTPSNATASVSTTSTVAFDGAVQVKETTFTNAITATFGAPTGITEHAMYVFKLKAGDTSARVYAWNAAYKFPAATPSLTAGTTTSGAFDVITFIGGASNVLIYQGHQADVR